MVNGVKQIPMAGNRAIYHDGWFARTLYKAPWEPKPRRTLQDNSAWQLFDGRSDFSLANDLAAKHPEKLAEGMTGMLEGVFVNVKNRSSTISAEAKSRFTGRIPKVTVQVR